MRPGREELAFAAGRRAFLIGTAAVGGALLVGCAAVTPYERLGRGRDFPAPPGEASLNAWLRIAPDNRVTVAIARAEMGQGVTTALAMLVAEELDCAWSDVRYELVAPQKVHGNVRLILEGLPFRGDDTGSMARIGRWFAARLAGQGTLVTGGSTSVRDAWEVLRLTGATARHALLAAAAQSWNVPNAQVRGEAGHAVGPQGQRLSYGALAEAAAGLPVSAEVRPKPAAARKLLGTSPRRLDVPAKTDGGALFGADVRLPGQLYAAVQMCPVAGGTLHSFDDTAARKMPGVQAILPFPSEFGSAPGVLAVAGDSWSARRAVEAIKVQWDEGAHAAYDSDRYLQAMRLALDTESGSVWHVAGDLAQVQRAGAKPVQAEYVVPLLAHAALETASCTALWQTGADGPRLKLWAPTQMPALNAQIAAATAGLAEDRIHLQPTLIGGGFGYKGLPDPVVQAVTAAKALPDRPVQVHWTREQDLAHDMYRPPAVARLSAWLDAGGGVAGWQHRSAGPSVVHSIVARMVPGWIARRIPDKTDIEGAFDSPYEFGAARFEHVTTRTTMPLGFWRSVGHSHQAFFVESFMDELAQAAGRDPLEYRLALLRSHPRHAAVLKAAAERAGWSASRPSGSALGLALHESFGSICAQAAELRRDEAGAIHIERIVCAIDCGTVIHPDSVAQQLEGGAIFGLTAALYGQITVRQGRAQESNFGAYRLLAPARAPRIETVILRSDAEPGGVGEVATPPAAPALCNALYRLTGTRIRRLPVGDQLTLA